MERPACCTAAPLPCGRTHHAAPSRTMGACAPDPSGGVPPGALRVLLLLAALCSALGRETHLGRLPPPPAAAAAASRTPGDCLRPGMETIEPCEGSRSPRGRKEARRERGQARLVCCPPLLNFSDQLTSSSHSRDRRTRTRPKKKLRRCRACLLWLATGLRSTDLDRQIM